MIMSCSQMLGWTRLIKPRQSITICWANATESIV